jgi:hypothetical protein
VPHFDEDTGQFMAEVFDKGGQLPAGRRICDIFAAS